MKNISINIISFFAQLIPIKFLIKITGINVVYPFYHTISDNPPSHIKHLYKVKSTSQFRKDLEFLSKFFKNTNTINTNLKNKEPQFYLSFDDGLQECYSIISPILKEYNIKATFFINSDFANNKNLFFRYKTSIILDYLNENNISNYEIEIIENLFYDKVNFNLKEIIKNIKFKDKYLLDKIAEILNINFQEYLTNEKPYLTSKQIKELINQGHKIGSHSKNHPLFSEINKDEQFAQTSISMKFISDNFNIKYKLFAFPFTDDKIKTSFFKKVFKENIIDYSFGTAGIKKDIIKNNIQRIPLEKRNISAKKYIKTEYLLFFLKKIFKKHIIFRK